MHRPPLTSIHTLREGHLANFVDLSPGCDAGP